MSQPPLIIVVSAAEPHWRRDRHSPAAWADARRSRLADLIYPYERRFGQGHVHGGRHGGGARAAAMAGGGGPWAVTSGRDGAWAVSGGGRGGPWAITSGGRGGPWAITTNAGRYSLYAMNGAAWPGRSAQWPALGVGWQHTGHHWPAGKSPGHTLSHRGWGILWHNSELTGKDRPGLVTGYVRPGLGTLRCLRKWEYIACYCAYCLGMALTCYKGR